MSSPIFIFRFRKTLKKRSLILDFCFWNIWFIWHLVLRSIQTHLILFSWYHDSSKTSLHFSDYSPLDSGNGSCLSREGLHSYYLRQWENPGQRRHEGYFLRKPSCLLFPPGDNNVQNDQPRNFPSWRPTQSTNHLDVNMEKYSVKKTKKRNWVKWPSYLNPLSTNRRRNTTAIKKKQKKRKKRTNKILFLGLATSEAKTMSHQDYFRNSWQTNELGR